jgi:hypothetical protein
MTRQLPKIAFELHRLTNDEIPGEINADVHRILLKQLGYERFFQLFNLKRLIGIRIRAG